MIKARSKLMVAQDADQQGSLEVERNVLVATRGVFACLAFLGGLDGRYVVEYQLGDEELRASVGDLFVGWGLNGRVSGQCHRDGGGYGKGGRGYEQECQNR